MINNDSLSFTDSEMLNAVVLVVDDDPSTVDFFVQALSPYYRTFSAPSGEDAIGFCAVHAPDLVILDLHMPDLDGMLTCKMLKAIPSMLNCPIIFSTEDTNTDQEIRCWDAGATDFVCKPIVIQTLVKRIRSHIQIKMQHDLIENLVFVDQQTGLYNRRYFNDFYQKQMALAKRNDAPLSLVMFEVKNGELFKSKTLPVAAKHIKMFAELISKELSRPTDTLMRFSETKLAVLLPDTYIFGAKHIIQKVMTSISQFKCDSDESAFEKIDIVSGLASVEGLQKNTNLIELVIQNLSQSKRPYNESEIGYQFY